MKKLMDSADFEGKAIVTLTDNDQEIGEVTFQLLGIREIDPIGNVNAVDLITGEKIGFDEQELLHFPTYVLEREELEVFKRMVEHYQKIALSGSVLAS